MTTKYFGGCDVGSTTGKAVILDENGKIVASSIGPSEIDP
jgi:activator of 2-hydroxyglutaryl-CoA dehydratase